MHEPSGCVQSASDHTAARRLFNNAGSAPTVPLEDSPSSSGGGWRRQPEGVFLLRNRRSLMKAQNPRAAGSSTRLHRGACTSSALGALRGPSMVSRADTSDRSRWPTFRHRLRPNRIGNAATTWPARTLRRPPPAELSQRAPARYPHVVDACLHGNLPLDANVRSSVDGPRAYLPRLNGHRRKPRTLTRM